MTATTRSTIFSAPYSAVYDIINTRSNIADPRDVTGVRKFVYTSEPFGKAIDVGDVPYIIVKFPTIDQTTASINGKHKWITYSQSIIVRTVKDGSGASRPDAGVNDMEAITDDLFETFNKYSTKTTFKSYLLTNVEIKLINNDSANINQQDIFENEFELTYGMRFNTST